MIQTQENKLLGDLKTALIHDWLVGFAGGEQVLLEMARLFPDAPIYTALYRQGSQPEALEQRTIQTSFLQSLPGAVKHYQALLPLMPLAFEAFDLRGYDLVLSSSHACAKGVITGPNTLHVSYVHTPIRYAWDMMPEYFEQSRWPRWKRALAHPVLHYLRAWDQLNTQRIDHLLCNSRFVQRRIKKFYRREASVLYPPVEVPMQLPPREPAEFFLYVGRLVPYKRVDLIVETFNRNDLPLKIAGTGPEWAYLKAQARPNIEFLGHVDQLALEGLYRQARALIFPPLEDFGIVPVEAQAFGCPVVAYGRGGALESVVPEETGIFFMEQTPESLQVALNRFESLNFKSERLHAQALLFSRQRFQRELSQLLEQLWRDFDGPGQGLV